MSLLTTLSLVTVVLSALYLLTLGAASLFAPAHAGRFLLGFASSPAAHYAELSIRLAVGAALVQYAPNMHFSSAFNLFGWVLLLTTLGLLALPWHWHRRFAQHAVAGATRFIALIGIGSLSLGAAVVYAVIHGHAT